MSPIVASLALEAHSADRGDFVLTIEVGLPYRSSDHYDEWVCPVALRPLRVTDARGGDSFQALCLALSLVLNELQGFRDNGMTLLMGGDDFPIDAYWFWAARG